ncbi:uncharacterized protein ColSpa_03825 [Colletotrichum spaethianum]|uniref:Uncharacterized protein n=1 Tax=Colletotrichum spaethianum TaxID=700344 RepID=A0AA37LAC4_9PEZI|nr:uncharacterized protein ColSpa_03825 [Colletotrichum spaethianum]GKT43644.1 hypothetical protein ColSpa_03825 [Colletotrichum spaethianum]
MDSMWQDEQCCLAICLAVNCPHTGLTDDTWYPPFDKVKEDINSISGDRFIAYVISCLCGPLQGKEFVVKVAALLACLKVRKAHEQPDDGPSGNRTNLLFEFDKALNFGFGNLPVIVKVLEQVLMFSARIMKTLAPEDAIQPGLLPANLPVCDDSVSRKMLYMYCFARISFSDTHESSMHRTRAVFQLNTADASELFLDTLSDGELELAGHSMCGMDEGPSDEEYVSSSDADSSFVGGVDLSEESSEFNTDGDEDDVD